MAYATIKSILVFVLVALALGLFAVQVYQSLWVRLKHARAGPTFDRWGERIKGLIVYVGGQLRLFRFLPPGIAHFFIFWGFILLLLTILQAILEGLLAFRFPDFTLPLIGEFGPLALVQDLIILFVLLAVLYGLYVRLIVNPERYRGSHKGQGVMVLGFIMTIMLSLLIMNGIRANLGKDALANWRPISGIVGEILAGLNPDTQAVIEETSYWLHLGVVLIFLVELPRGKHYHVVTSLPAVLLRDLSPRGRLPAAPQTDGSLGVRQIYDFDWRSLFDFYTCTECGRCQEVCPAYLSGRPLSPKLLIMRLREELKRRYPRKSPTAPQAGQVQPALVGEVIEESTLWSCTTCAACDQECPLFIEHIKPIVNMRRYLVCEGRVDLQLQDALANLARYGNSFGQSPRMRAHWAQTIQPTIKDARREPVEYLWILGDYASFHASAVKITQKAAAVFHAARMDFGILYDSEVNSGNDVRRVGEEGLFEMLVEKNCRVLNKCEFRAIVTTDPHTYNTLKNEYPAELLDGRPIMHYTELLDQLITSGALEMKRKLNYRVTYHDPCYLGRINQVYEAPRRVIAATGCKVIEMPRHRDRALCCGAGGGRIWMEEGVVRERPSEARLREAAALEQVTVFIVSCPKDVTMYLDAIKTTGLQERMTVKDVIDLVYEAMCLSDEMRSDPR